MDCKDKTVVITGGTKGIGRAIAKRCVALGAHVVVTYKRDGSTAESLKKGLKGKLLIIKGDASSEKDVKRVIEKALKEFGRIDVLVNNAGTDNIKLLWKYSLAEWNEILSVNLTSVFLFTKYAAPYLEKTRGVIVNISSRLGMPNAFVPDAIPYSVSKAGVTKLTLDSAKALAERHIRVNAVIPTVTRTDMLRFFTKEQIERIEKEKRLGEPEEVAELVMELVEDKSANGKILIDKRVRL